MPTIPSHQDIKKPLLSLLKRKDEVSLVEALVFVAKKFDLSSRMQKKLQGCGKETVLQNRLRWARWELQKEGAVVTTRRGYFRFRTNIERADVAASHPGACTCPDCRFADEQITRITAGKPVPTF